MKFVALEGNCSVLQRPLTADQISSLCLKAFGDSARLEHFEQLFTGKFNTTYRLNLGGYFEVILRVEPPCTAPVFQHETLLLRREQAVQAFLADLGGIIPRILFSDFSRQLIDRDYLFLNVIDGELWEDVKDKLGLAHNQHLWRQLGGLAKKIHATRGNSFGVPQAKPSFSAWDSALINTVNGMLDDLRLRRIEVEGADKFHNLLSQNRELLNEITSPRLVHGDLWPNNILIDYHQGTPYISGILDAERAFWGDPAAEWIFAFLDIPDIFWTAYGRDFSEIKLSREALFRRKAYEARGALQLILEAWRVGFDPGFAHNILAQALQLMSDISEDKRVKCIPVKPLAN